ncbi:DNAase [Vibrio cincinnatiensis]|uniref:DNAase n=1 Tax=Vibrio cincinnatiensis TaxID=675 RepID=UPI001EE07849|nr:DNAase [Vibrio cincinnatiensis]MCG3758850.1 DNAase [Vibrio cincinnatiensis]MCG3762200.1 DNAase [Vibrio cincinnatiensis]
MIEIKTTDKTAQDAIKKAFRACPGDYQIMLDEITAGRVSIYRVFDTSHDVLIAGEVMGDTYFIWGAVGHGLISAVLELKKYTRAAGLKEMSAITYFPAVARLCKKICEIEAGTISNIKMGV